MSTTEPVITPAAPRWTFRPRLRGLALRCVMGLMYLRRSV